VTNVSNGQGDFVTLSGSDTLTKRTAAQVLSDIGAQASLTNPITGTGTSGQVSFFTGTTTQGGDNGLFWDNTNKRLGIGDDTPAERLDILGNIALTKALLSNQENLSVDTGAIRVIATISSSDYNAAFFDFVIKKGDNLRAGTVYAVHDGSLIEFTETSTNDLGNTNEVILEVDLSGGNIRLLAKTDTDGWEIKTMVRGI
jgi:hypothetical protein